MKRLMNAILLTGAAILITLIVQTNVVAQIRLSELEVDTPNSGAEPCEYIEVQGSPGATVPANTFFLSIDSDAGQLGFIDYIMNLSGVQFGANGTITIVSYSDTCPGRIFPAETRVVQSPSVAMGFGAETFLLTKTTQPKLLFEGQDLDVNDDGVLDAKFGLTTIDGIGWILDPARNKLYGGVPAIFQGRDLPDAATRFPGAVAAFSAAAWYYGEVAPPEHSIAYKAPHSPNFPQGGALTPGAPNVGGPARAAQQRHQVSRK
jgi:hypothetical protein